MSIAELDPASLSELLSRLQMMYDKSLLEEEFGVTIPPWLSIKYKCVACAKETRMRIQVKNIPSANKQLTCPFCRKVSKMFLIHVEKESTGLSKDDFKETRQSDNNPLQFL